MIFIQPLHITVKSYITETSQYYISMVIIYDCLQNTTYHIQRNRKLITRVEQNMNWEKFLLRSRHLVRDNFITYSSQSAEVLYIGTMKTNSNHFKRIPHCISYNSTDFVPLCIKKRERERKKASLCPLSSTEKVMKKIRRTKMQKLQPQR